MIIWSANQDKPVGENSVLIFSVGGALALKDSKGHPIWSTDSSQSSAFGMSMNNGNLVLLNQTNVTIWQSFDHPTNTLLWGQMLKKGQQLTSSISSVDLGSGLFYLCLENYYLSAYATGGNTYNYLQVFPVSLSDRFSLTHIQFEDGNVIFYYQGQKGQVQFTYETPVTTDFELLTLDADGGIKLYGWDIDKKWWLVYYFSNGLQWDECQFPLKCGRYGLCQNGQCGCPVPVDGTALFEPFDSQHPSRGCHQINDSEGLKGTDYSYELRSFGHLSYFSSYDVGRAAPGLEDEESCKQACLRNGTSCMAAFFYFVNATTERFCYLVEDVFSIIANPMSDDDLTSLYLMVKISSTTNMSIPVPPTPTTPFHKSRTLPIFLAACGFVLLCIFISLLLLKRKKICREKLYLKRLSETLLRFSYSELSISTQNFSQKLGGGGFGPVFKGTLADGREVAVKRLEADGQGKKEFLAEVETVGKIHHFNLVSLIGFCVENKHMIIVYEYLANGSLDKWILSENQSSCLDWEVRKKIVLGVAKGLVYIHEECRQRIAHLDIKPHNVLLDDSFNAKISDFGMSKLINREKSQVMTEMRGTLGYLAPEWRGSRITVKADVYSFGILVLEAISGRKVLDYSQPESGVHLLKLLKKKSVENRLWDIADFRCEDIVSNCENVVGMIRLAMWCRHRDYYNRRPAMSTVVKVLEGSLELEPNFTYNFSSIFSPVCSVSNA